MSDQLSILQHSLGVDQYGHGVQYRNCFVTGPGTDDYPICKQLVADGLMGEQRGSDLTGGDPWFYVTRKGKHFISEHSPKPPKLTRGQKRYRAFLEFGFGMTFGEWLKSRSYA